MKKTWAFVAKHRDMALGAAVWTVIILTEAFIALYESRAYVPSPDFWPLFVRRMLLPTLPFLVICAVHDLLLAPMLVNGKKTVPYIICTAALLGFFSAYMLCFDSPGRPERFGQEPPEPRELYGEESFGGREGGRHPESPETGEQDSGASGRGYGPIDPGEGGEEPPVTGGGPKEPPMRRDGLKEPPGRGGGHPADPEIFKIILAAMMLAADLGWKYYVSYTREKHRLERLEKENLQYRLEGLRYQINPHFFMNTLNNIHALVDISPEKAKESIVELSRLMRHVLYDSSGPTADLSKEIDFLRHYIYLMRLRYTDNVRIECSFPEGPVTAQAPPLLMSTIVENAFKHGVSAGGESFISLSVSVEGGKVIFRCANSLVPESGGESEPAASKWCGARLATKSEPERPVCREDSGEEHNAARHRFETSGGLGLENISKRLSLLYGERYLLHIDRKENEYDVLLVFPAQP